MFQGGPENVLPQSYETQQARVVQQVEGRVRSHNPAAPGCSYKASGSSADQSRQTALIRSLTAESGSATTRVPEIILWCITLTFYSYQLTVVVKGLKDCWVLSELKNRWVSVAVVQEIHLIHEKYGEVLELDYVVVLEFDYRLSAGVSLLIEFSLDVDVIFSGKAGRPSVVDVAMRSYKFWEAAVYVPNCVWKRPSFFRRLEPYLSILMRFLLVGDWSAILDSK